MSDFKLNITKKEELTLGDISDLGWTQQTIEREHKYKTFYHKDNYFLIAYTGPGGPIIEIGALDPSKIEWMPDPERFRITIKCPTVEAFTLITNLL